MHSFGRFMLIFAQFKVTYDPRIDNLLGCQYLLARLLDLIDSGIDKFYRNRGIRTYALFNAHMSVCLLSWVTNGDFSLI